MKKVDKPVMRKRKYINIQAYLAACETALLNAADVEIAPLLTKRGYHAELIADKLSELRNLKDLIIEKKKKYGRQYAITQAYAETTADLHERYIDQLALARVVFKNDPTAQIALGLRGIRYRTESAYCSQALLFYNGLLNDDTYLTAMHQLGIDIDELNRGKAGYEDLSLKSGDKAQKTGEARSATQVRNEAIHHFVEWFSDFKKIARIALSKNPQLCEKMGWKS